MEKISITQKDIAAGLRDLGLRRSDAVEVHSSLSSFGWVEGGATTVIEALMQVVSEEGALVMSAYPVSPPIPLTEEEEARGITWKVRILDPHSDERTGLGIVADTFRKRPDVVCGTEFHRGCAWGHDAHLHCQNYKHLLEIDGWVLLLGVDIGRCSSMHLAESVPIPEEIRECFKVPTDILRDYPQDRWGIGYGSTPGNPWLKVWEEALRRGLVRTRTIGQSECKLFKARAMVSIYEDMRRTDPFGIFGLKKE
ncbi:MAG TPA: AAC(3) family N-acetyltransferase [Anaerolineae bacterium]|nr:AAC(3) family N-acetyltransferase [Anaerolineae bacterium]